MTGLDNQDDTISYKKSAEFWIIGLDQFESKSCKPCGVDFQAGNVPGWDLSLMFSPFIIVS